MHKHTVCKWNQLNNAKNLPHLMPKLQVKYVNFAIYRNGSLTWEVKYTNQYNKQIMLFYVRIGSMFYSGPAKYC